MYLLLLFNNKQPVFTLLSIFYDWRSVPYSSQLLVILPRRWRSGLYRPVGRNSQRGVRRLALRVTHLVERGTIVVEALGCLVQNPTI